MKVLHICSENTWRGGERQIAYLICELEKLNVKSYVVCRKGSVFEEYCKNNLIEYTSLPFKSSYEITSAIRIKKLCKYNDIDILHMHSSKGHTLGVISSLLGNKSKLVLSRRVDFPVKNWLSKWKYNYSPIKKIICVSERIKEVMSPFIKDKKRLVVAHSGIDINRFNGMMNSKILHYEYGLSDDTKIVANISALADHKDYPTFINVVKEFKNICNKKVKFFIVGEGSLKYEIESLIEENELNNDIIMTGFRNDIADIFLELNVFLITSKEEGLGTTVLDAFASKIPVVASAGGGIPEMIEHDTTGLLYEIGDFKGMAEGVKLLLENDEVVQRLTNEATNKLIGEFTNDITAKKTLEVYENL
ncbi:MAG: glycosyltransferase family 4 protein [Bacteroidetes bacterium]|nr:glycosyltransferase family 4 protein [Bacteroidota bacterium]